MARAGRNDERLARVSLFEGLSKRQPAQISSLMTSVELSAGVLRDGEVGRRLAGRGSDG